MVPGDDWLLLLNFYLITCSGDVTLCTNSFSDERLAQAYRDNPGQSYQDMVATATQLVLEFEHQKADTESQNLRLAGGNKETPHGPVPISLPYLPGYV